MISFLRNLACGEISDIDIVFKQLTNSNADSTHFQLIDLLEDKLSMSCSTCTAAMETYPTSNADATEMSSRQTSSENVITDASKEQILIQTIYTFSNIATGNLVHKAFVLERPRVMKAVVESLVGLSLRFNNAKITPFLISFFFPLRYFSLILTPKSNAPLSGVSST